MTEVDANHRRSPNVFDFLRVTKKLQGTMEWAENSTKVMMLSIDKRGERCISLKEAINVESGT